MGDYFSTQANIYAKYRPTYPPALFEFICNLCPEKNLVWDCATGNGQAAVALSDYFRSVVATDLSPQQIQNAQVRPNVTYKVESAEQCSLASGSADLITIATALHWLDTTRFYSEVKRILRQGGIFAVWSYASCTVSHEIDKVVKRFTFEILKNYWPEGIMLNFRDKYQTLPFPFELMQTPVFIAKTEYSFDDFIQYLSTWSGTQQFIKQHKKNPVDLIADELKSVWGIQFDIKPVEWEIFLKCGRKF